ncbi:hypothetical protein KAR91_69710 [Candidatus Pacearchaeota archaeon]|nr:hypothetical protein [Candidatus Pacearchaeota archaeon]
MEDQIIIKAQVEKKSRVLAHPDLYTDTNMICFIVPRDYEQALINFGRTHDLSSIELTLAPWPEDVTERAHKFFFALRDRLAAVSDGEKVDKEHRDSLYRNCITEFGFPKDGGGFKNSIKDLGKRELWLCTELMMDWCVEAKANVEDMKPEYKFVQKEMKA